MSIDVDKIYLDWIEWSKSRKDSPLQNGYNGTDGVYAEWSDYKAEQKMRELYGNGPKCECGTSIALGKEDQPQFHSDWCPVKRKAPPEEPPKLPTGFGY